MDLHPLTPDQLAQAASTCLHLQATAQDIHRKRPFVAVLLAPDNTTVLLSSNSLSHVRHAECELARNAADNFDATYLAACTLVSTWEPCAMCAATIYWARIGRLVYLASEAALRDLVGPANPENLTMTLDCRVVFAAGQTHTEVIGPVPVWEDRVVQDARRFWDAHRGSGVNLA